MRLLTAFAAFILAASVSIAQPILRSGWTTNDSAPVARSHLGILSTTESTNLAQVFGTNSTNFTLWVGANATSYVNSVGTVISNAAVLNLTNTEIIYVSVSGDDATAVRGNPQRPWLTIAAAATNMANNRMMSIGPGDFTVTPPSKLGPPVYGTDAYHFEGTNFAVVQLTNMTNIAIIGSGPSTRIVLSDEGHVFALGNIDGAKFENFYVVGIPFSNNTNINEYHALFTLIKTNYNLAFRNLNLKGSQHGISQLWGPKHSQNVLIENCYFYGFGITNHPVSNPDGSAISGVGSRWTISHNTFDYCVRDVEFESIDYNLALTDNIAEGNLHVNNRSYSYMIWPRVVAAPNIRNIVIRGNIITNKVTTVGLAPGGGSVYGFGGKNIVIEGNIFLGLRAANSSGVTFVCPTTRFEDSVIRNNFFENLGSQAIYVAGPSFGGYYPSNIVVRGNVLKDIGMNSVSESSILLEGENCSIDGNIIVNPTVQLQYGGMDLTNVSRSVIRGNSVVDLRSPTKTQCGIRLSAGTNNYVFDNYFQNCTTNFHDIATGTVTNLYGSLDTNAVLVLATNVVESYTNFNVITANSLIASNITITTYATNDALLFVPGRIESLTNATAEGIFTNAFTLNGVRYTSLAAIGGHSNIVETATSLLLTNSAGAYSNVSLTVSGDIIIASTNDSLGVLQLPGYIELKPIEVAQFPTSSAYTNGMALVNSNGQFTVLISTNGGTGWGSTNVIAP